MHRLQPLRLAPFALLLAAAPVVAAQTTAYVITTDFGTGSVAQIALDTRSVVPNLASVHSDARARWHDGLLWVINRFGQDNIQVLDPAQGFATVRQFSTGAGSNPHDIAFVSPTKAYVTRYELADLLIVNPQTGAALGTIPLGAFADADGIPEMDQMIRVGPLVFVSVQRLDRNAGFAPADSSLIVVIDSRTDTVVDANPALPGTQAIRLAGTQPFTDFAFDRATSRLLIGCVGFFGVQDGGIERVDPVNLVSEGFVITEAALGGDVIDLVWDDGARAFAIVADASFNTLLVAWDPAGGALTDTLFAPGGFSLADAALNDRGELYVAKNDFLAPGVFVFDAASGALFAGPLDTGLPPFQIVFDETGVVASVPRAGGGLEFAPPWPNPAAGEVRLRVSLAADAKLEAEVLDPAGRRVRTLFRGAAGAGVRELRWDLRDQAGAQVAAGVYWVTVSAGGVRRTHRVVAMP